MSDLVLGGVPVREDDDKIHSDRRQRKPGLERRTLADIAYYPTPQEIYEVLMTGEGWDYQDNKELYLVRDRALDALIYLLCLRISEAVLLTRDQFLMPYQPGGRKDSVVVRAIYLSKRRYKGKPRLVQYRDLAYLPLNGERAPLTLLVVKWLQTMDQSEHERLERGKKPRTDDRLFRFGETRGWQITVALTGATNHWFRAFGETYLYDAWGSDLLAVADYVKVDSRTLAQYIRRGYQRHISRTGPV